MAGVLTLTMLPRSLPAFATVIIAVLAAAIAGMVYSLLLAFASINLKADQTIGGTALNLLATAVAVVISKNFSDSGSAKLNYSNKPFLFSIGGLELSIFVPLGIALLIISYIVLYKTRFGLRLRACGEHPQAADSVGINVYKMRYAGVVISGALGAIGGLAYIVPPVQTWNFEVGVAGAGFLAMAVMIFGQWKPFNICGAAMFFAVFKSLANIANSTFPHWLAGPASICNMIRLWHPWSFWPSPPRTAWLPRPRVSPTTRVPADSSVFSGRSCFSGRLRPTFFFNRFHKTALAFAGKFAILELQCHTIAGGGAARPGPSAVCWGADLHAHYDLIAKRDGGTHSREELETIVNGFVSGEVADYQMAAWMMAVYLRGMTDEETAELTDVMAHSGVMVDLSPIPGIKVDKHSTGGVVTRPRWSSRPSSRPAASKSPR